MSITFTCDQFTKIIDNLQIIINDDCKDTKYETDIQNYDNKYNMYALVGYRQDTKRIFNDIFILDNAKNLSYEIILNNLNNEDQYVINEDITINIADIKFSLLGDLTDDIINNVITECTPDIFKNYKGTLYLSFYKDIIINQLNSNVEKSTNIFFRLHKEDGNLKIANVNALMKTEGYFLAKGGNNMNDNNNNENENNNDNDNELNNQLIEGGSDKLYKVYDNNNSNNNKNNKRHSFKRKNN